jgi:predicted Zn-dependent protease with MMP-like domain
MRGFLRPTLGGVSIIASVAGVVLLVLNPPSLAGAEEVVVLVVAAVALVLVSAWVTVALMGRDAMSEREFERVIERSERLARQGEEGWAPTTEFDALVAEAIDRLPPEFRELLEDTPVVVSRRGSREGAYGHYFGDTVARDDYESRIVLYRDTLERDFGHDPDLLANQIERTLRHELAHHLGWREGGVRDLGL